jgi:hypothetical protein
VKTTLAALGTCLCVVGAVALADPAGRATVATGGDPLREVDGAALPLPPARQIYVMTDKPLYRPGETIWFRIWELDRSLAPVASAGGLTVALVDPRGAVAVEKRLRAMPNGTHNDFALATDLPGGRYGVRVTSDGGAIETREITIATYEVPQLQQTIEFGRRGYAPGDDVIATVTVRRATGEPARGVRIRGVVVVDGATVAQPTAVVGKDGRAVLRFSLPSQIAKGDGLLTAVATDRGASASIQRRIPIATGAVALALYPEGGDLIAELPGRVYFAATSSIGEPVDVTGRIVDDRGVDVAAFASTFRGRGAVSFVPAAGRSYRAIVDKPATGGAPIALPAVHGSGCVLSIPDAANARSIQIDASVACTDERPVAVIATLRDRPVGRATATATRAPVSIHLPLAAAGQGAVRVTLVDAQNRPLAERLVYRKLGSDLSIRVTPDRDGYAPRDRVSLAIETRDGAGKPVAADLAVAVVDDSVLTMADDRAGRILAQLYLEPEMPGQTIADPNFYFSDDPKAPAALDLILGTQGWRRFKAR